MGSNFRRFPGSVPSPATETSIGVSPVTGTRHTISLPTPAPKTPGALTRGAGEAGGVNLPVCVGFVAGGP